MDHESKQQFTVEKMQEIDIDAVTEMRLQSWLDTYPNDAHNVSHEWVEKRNSRQRSEEMTKKRHEIYNNSFAKGTGAGWIARNLTGIIIGAATPYVDTEGIQHIGSLYVDKSWHGKGVASALMQKIVNWFDDSKPITLGVVTYNERAKTFYRKWKFEEVADSETLFDGKIPELVMIRKATND